VATWSCRGSLLVCLYFACIVRVLFDDFSIRLFLGGKKVDEDSWTSHKTPAEVSCDWARLGLVIMAHGS
jgi:hypothetical protein